MRWNNLGLNSGASHQAFGLSHNAGDIWALDNPTEVSAQSLEQEDIVDEAISTVDNITYECYKKQYNLRELQISCDQIDQKKLKKIQAKRPKAKTSIAKARSARRGPKPSAEAKLK